MADAVMRGDSRLDPEHGGPPDFPDQVANAMATAFHALASLKLTVALFAMAIFLVLAGTLAQTDKDIWEVVDEYFRAFVCRIDVQDFFPASFFPSQPQVPGWIPFPGGWLIGLVMAANLLAAHSIRFTPQAKGLQLFSGIMVIAAGVFLTAMVIMSGSNTDGLGEQIIEWSAMRSIMKWALGAIWLASFVAVFCMDVKRRADSIILTGVSALLGGLVVWFFYHGDQAVDDSAMRILWQLVKASTAGIVLLAGCAIVFRKRAGIVLLHGGIGLMMINEILVGTYAVENQMPIQEGETVNYVVNHRRAELALVDPSEPDEDVVTVIPESVLTAGNLIQHDDLPVDVKLVEFFKNSVLKDAKPDEPNPATTGQGLISVAKPVKPGVGTDTGGEVDIPSAYVQLTRRGTDTHVGTFLVSPYLREQPISIDGKTYNLALRFRRTYKEFSMRLLDVRKDDYLGTNTPRNYSSDVHLVDPTRNEDREIKIWMNNPLRYAGETFYQSSYHRDEKTGIESTTLQVVTNTGWMIPYVSCMIVAIGMLAHFWITLSRFLSRRLADRSASPGPHQPKQPLASSRTERLSTRIAVAVPVLLVGLVLSRARVPSPSEGVMDLHAFGCLPVVEQGRVKPFDSLARNNMRILLERETFKDETGKTQPAIRWLLDVIARPEVADDHRVFRIDNLELLDTLGLVRRKDFRYSVEDIRGKLEEFEKQSQLAHSLEAANLSVYQRKVIELDQKLRAYMRLSFSFQPPSLPDRLPAAEEIKAGGMDQRIAAQLHDAVIEAPRRLAAMQPPLAVPVPSSESENKDGLRFTWEPYATAWAQDYVQSHLFNRDPAPTVAAMHAILEAYQNDDVESFRRSIEAYQKLLGSDPPSALDPSLVRFEAFFNHFSPFFYASILYLVAFVISSVAALGWSAPLNRSAFVLIFLTFLIHTFALVSRIYISGRPPVTNLYSSAVFIGWGCVLLGMFLELVYRTGMINLVSSATGFATLLIADKLALDGDTFTVMQAVLDTQFWLATHVVCITLGYSTTFFAGMLGVMYVLRGIATPSLSPDASKSLARMIYGTICFAIFFSFVGTVLGGLWADDSWGRFWGWDPKENGALIIVLWNALVLHARWGGMVKDRGLAALAVGGNIATSWSWFGVNELGVGLHSYGFTEGVMLALGLFVASQLAVIAVAALIPKEYWWSHRAHNVS